MKKMTDLEKQLAALPPCQKRAHKWTLQEDAAILKFAEEKGVNAVAKVLGLNNSVVRRRFEYLQSKMKS